MIVRVATFHSFPTDDRGWVLDSLRGVPGVRATYHLRDPQSSEGLSISIFDTEEGIQAATEAIGARAREIGHQGPGPDEVRVYELVGHVENL